MGHQFVRVALTTPIFRVLDQRVVQKNPGEEKQRNTV
jgi:hypothetical protein